ncbi:MAG: hypothetical protein EB154_08755, partial [Nitrosopumilaceae archaeon]|nr:hypothetical protein [Nitrososphaerota archaeon]NDF35918.1 hypothetical protein [Nitrosopumilaceae archaeon]
MNRLTKVAICSAIFAVSMGVLSLNGFSGIPMATAIQQTTSAFVPMQGHVEYTVRNAEGLVTAYYQGDNRIVDGGDRCAAARLFNNNDNITASNFSCTSVWSSGSPGFTVIGIGNTTSPAATADTDRTIGAPTSNSAGEMARVRGTVSATTNTGGVVVTITNSAHPFVFKSGVTNQNSTNSGTATTTITQAGLFNDTGIGNTGSATSHTTAFGAGRMFAVQNLSPTVTVANGDTLTVTWTVTVGSSS